MKFRTTNSTDTRMVVVAESMNVSVRKIIHGFISFSKKHFPSKLARRPYFFKLTVTLPPLSATKKHELESGLDSGCDATYGNLGMKIDLRMSPSDFFGMS